MMTGFARTFVQLSIVGLILRPIFIEGTLHPAVVGLYLFFMTSVASFESSRRPKYVFSGMFWVVFGSIFSAVGIVFGFALVFIIKPDPIYDPRYVIPMCGMLLGNAVSATSLSLNYFTTRLVEQRNELEALLAFGANKHEACRVLLREATRQGFTPNYGIKEHLT